MKKGLRYTMYFVGLLWLLVLMGWFMVAYCDEPSAMNMVVGVFPAALVGSVAVFIEYRCERGDHD